MRTFLFASVLALGACQGNATTDSHSLWGSLTATVSSVGTSMTAAAATPDAGEQAALAPAPAPTDLVPTDDPWATPTAQVSDHVDTVAVARALAEELPGA